MAVVLMASLMLCQWPRTVFAQNDAAAALSQATRSRAEREQKARGRAEGFRTNNNKYGVEASKYLNEAYKFSAKSNPKHQDLAAIFEEANAIDAKASEILKRAAALKSGNANAAAALTTAELRSLCQPAAGSGLIPLGGGGERSPASDNTEILNSGSFRVDNSRDIGLGNRFAPNNQGSASRIPSKAGK